MNSLANQSHDRTTGSARASRWVLTVASALALALAGCSSGSAAVTTPSTPPLVSTPVATPSAPTPAPSASTGGSGSAGDTIQLSAQGIQFSTKQLQIPAGKAFTITFQNNDSGISHNVDILDANNASIFKGAIFPGVASQTYQVPALKAGTYGFICDVHPNIMTGTLAVK